MFQLGLVQPLLAVIEQEVEILTWHVTRAHRLKKDLVFDHSSCALGRLVSLLKQFQEAFHNYWEENGCDVLVEAWEGRR